MAAAEARERARKEYEGDDFVGFGRTYQPDIDNAAKRLSNAITNANDWESIYDYAVDVYLPKAPLKEPCSSSEVMSSA